MRNPKKERSLSEQLDQAVDSVLGGSGGENVHPRLAPLIGILQQLRALPREHFKARLKSDLERNTSMANKATASAAIRQTATPRLRVTNAAAAIEFYQKAFQAKEIMRFVVHGQIGYAELEIGNSIIALSDESLAPGYDGPGTSGGSPMSIQLQVEDADTVLSQAVAAGAKLVSPVQDHFYGHRGGSIADPFGLTWGIATHKEHVSLEEMHRRFEQINVPQPPKSGVSPIPKGYRTLTPYLVARDAPGLIDFVKQVFGAEESFRAIGSAGGIHCEVRIGNSMMMIGGGGPELIWRGEPIPMAFHIYVEDTDAVYDRALKAGAESIQGPADQDYGERSGSVKDQFGNHWYIATLQGGSYRPEDAPTVQPYLHPVRALPVIEFLKRAFGAREVARHASPDGVIHHAKLRIGDGALEMGEAHGPYQPMPGMFYLYVPNVDAVYRQAIEAGAASISEPTDQSYGDRSGGVKDVFGNQWHIATHIRDL